MDTRPFLFAVLAAAVAAAACDKQAKESQYATAAAPVKGTAKPGAIVPASPDQGRDHGNAAQQKGGSPHAGTAEPNGQH